MVFPAPERHQSLRESSRKQRHATSAGLQFPLIKRIWTSSFILVAAGLSAWLLALFYYLVDVRKWQLWCEPFVWIGCNALVIYLGSRIVPFRQIASYFVGGDQQQRG